MSYYEGCGEIDAEDALVELGLDNVAPIGQGEIEFSCPFEGHSMGDSHPSNHLSIDKLVYRCKGCHRSGTLLDLVGAVKRCSPIEALRWLRERYGEVYRPLKGSAAQEIEAHMERWSKRSMAPPARPRGDETIGPRSIFAMDWLSDHPAAAYMRSRGFPAEALDLWGVGFDRWTNRVTIPVRDEDGVLVGFKGRSIDPNAQVRYSLLGDVEGNRPRFDVGYGFGLYDTGSVIFNLYLARRTGRTGVLGEGELNSYAFSLAGVHNSMGIGMSSVDERQLSLISWYFDEIVLVLDSDAAGAGATWGWYDPQKDRWHDGLAKRLSARGVRVLAAPEHAGDPASMTVDERRWLVAEARPWIQVAVA